MKRYLSWILLAALCAPAFVFAQPAAPIRLFTSFVPGASGDADAAGRNPVLRVGEPVHVGWMAAWLSSREAEFITGQSIAVDGGSTILPGYFNAYTAGAPKKDFG